MSATNILSFRSIARAHVELLARIAARLDGHQPTKECWACGSTTRLERAHVIARVAGGSDGSKNRWILCHECHLEQPDGASVEGQTAWLLEHENELEVRLRIVREMFKPMLEHPDGEAWFAATEIREVMDRVSKQVGRNHRAGFRKSLEFELRANFEAWLAERGIVARGGKPFAPQTLAGILARAT